MYIASFEMSGVISQEWSLRWNGYFSWFKATNHSSFVFVSRPGSANILLTRRKNKRNNGTKRDTTRKHEIRLKALYFKGLQDMAKHHNTAWIRQFSVLLSGRPWVRIPLLRPKKTISFDRNLSFSVLFALRRVVLLRSYIVLRTVLFALQTYRRIKYT